MCCALSLLLLVTGCTLNPIESPTTTVGNAAVDENSTDKDADLITLIATMQPGERNTLGGMTVDSGQTYTAASGRLCKVITLSDMSNPGKIRSRLACRGSSDWFFATDIFSSEARGN